MASPDGTEEARLLNAVRDGALRLQAGTGDWLLQAVMKGPDESRLGLSRIGCSRLGRRELGGSRLKRRKLGRSRLRLREHSRD